MPRLSILIPTLECRKGLLARLMDCLTGQLTNEMQLLSSCDNGEKTIGDKRNDLLSRAKGDYLCFIDDDDVVSENYVSSILHALKSNPDCVGFRMVRYEQMYKSDAPQLVGTYWHTLTNARCGDYQLPNGLWRHDRWPGHLQPVRRDFAQQTKFQPWCFGEDRDYADRLKPLLKSEVFIDDDLYFYMLRHDAVRTGETVHPKRWQDDGQIRIQKNFTVPAMR